MPPSKQGGAGSPGAGSEMPTRPGRKNLAGTHRNQAEAKRVVAEAYPYQCCVVCGLQVSTCLTVAHLDHQPGNNDPANLAWLCGTHHWMFDCGFYPLEAIQLMRARWQETKGVPSHAARLKSAAVKAHATRRRSAIARKAWATRRASMTNGAPNEPS